MQWKEERAALYKIADELGLKGADKPIQVAMGTEKVLSILAAYKPPKLAACSKLVQQFYGDLGGTPAAAPAPTPPAVLNSPEHVQAEAMRTLSPQTFAPDALPEPPPGIVEAGAVDGHPVVAAPPATPVEKAPRKSRKKAAAPPPEKVTHPVESPAPPLAPHAAPPPVSPPVGQIPAPPAIGAVAAFDGFDNRGIGIIAADCCGSVASNNAVCLICPRADECMDVALAGAALYPERWKARPDLETIYQGPATAGEVRLNTSPEHVLALAAADDGGPTSVGGEDAAAAATPAGDDKPKRAKRKAADSIGDPLPIDQWSKVEQHDKAFAIGGFLVRRGVVPHFNKKVQTWVHPDGSPRVRMTKTGTPKPTVLLLGYAPAGDDTTGLVMEGDTWRWDCRADQELEHHLKLHINLPPVNFPPATIAA